MKDLRSTSILTATGVVAGVLAGAIVALSLVFAFQQMGPNLLSEAAGLLLGVALAVLIVDRVTARQRRRDWRFAHDIVARRMAATVVDTMRLLSIRRDRDTYAAHRHRMVEFADLCQFHFDDLDSNITALATIVDPPHYEASRTIELHLAWLVRTLTRRLSDELTPIAAWELQSAGQVTQMVMDYLHIDTDSAAREISDEVLQYLESAEARGYPVSAVSALLSERFGIQTSILDRYAPARKPGIMMDADLDLAVRYFTIDWWLLSRLEDRTA